jgi:hypothetical protein
MMELIVLAWSDNVSFFNGHVLEIVMPMISIFLQLYIYIYIRLDKTRGVLSVKIHAKMLFRTMAL